MKKYYTSIKFLCLFLVAVFLFQITASAGPITGTVTAEPINAEETLVEVTSLREESVKTFQKGNGNYVAAIYGEAVHYKDDDGNWQEIDNSLIPTTVSAARLADIGVNVTTANTSPVAYRKNASNPFEVNLPNTLTVNNPITVTYKGHTLGFSLQDMPLQSGTVAEVVNTASKAETTQLGEYSIISNDSVLSYGQVFPNTQLTYEMRGKKLKESLIFSAPPTQTTFTFRFYYEQLYPELLQTGEVKFYADNTKSGEPVFVIAAPYMFDSGEGYSAAVNVELVPVADGCLYKLTPDANWLNAKERVYPVTLDPTVTTSLTQTEIHDNCVHQSDPNTNYINADRLYVGSVVLSSGTFESRTYIKFPRVSSIPTTAFIANATMTLNHHANSSYQSGSNNTIDVYDCGSNAWGTSNITWNTQKNFVFTNRICSRVTDKSYSVENFDITTLVRSWYSTTASNNGLVIKPRTVYTNASNRTGYYSSDISSSISSKRPHITIEYYTAPDSVISPPEGASFYIRNLKTGRYITIYNETNILSQPIITAAFSASPAQRWRLEYESTNPPRYHLRSGLGQMDKFITKSSTQILLSTIATGVQGVSLVRYQNTNCYYITLQGEYIYENSANEVRTSNTTVGASSLWTFEAVYGIVAPLHSQMVNNAIPSKYKKNAHTSLSAGNALRLLKTSSVFIVNGHGTQDSINVGQETITREAINGLPANELRGCRLLIYVSCECGKGGTTAANMVTAAYNKGAKIVVGFKENMGAIADTWIDYLMTFLSQGQTVAAAMVNADNAAANDWEGDYENIRERTVCGNTAVTILY